MQLLLSQIPSLLPDGISFQIKTCDIYIKDGLIAGIDQIPEGFVPEKTIEGRNRLVIPGLINCHAHSYMSLFRNYADDLSFQDWLFNNIMPLEDTLTPEDAYWGNLLSCVEMIRSGTTCFVDMHMFKNQAVRAVRESGMRAVITRGLSGGMEPSSNEVDEGGRRRIQEAYDEIQDYRKDPNGRIAFLLAPHAIYTCDTGYLKHIIQCAQEWNLGFNVHLSETMHEYEESIVLHHCTPTEYLDSLGLFDRPTIAAHCVHLSDNDIRILAEKRVSVSSNPVSNLKLGSGIAPLTKLAAAGVNICLGTDSAASNNALNMFREMNAVSLIHKGLLTDPMAVSAIDTIRYATSCGAAAVSSAFGPGPQLGCIAVGAAADLAILDTNRPQFYPRNNLISSLSYSANGSEIETVIIDGELVMENGRLLTLDEERIYAEAQRISSRFKNNL